jgi:hypothetical protein
MPEWVGISRAIVGDRPDRRTPRLDVRTAAGDRSWPRS